MFKITKESIWFRQEENVVLCQEMFQFLSSMKIDEARNYVLSKYSKSKGEVVVTESDHNPIICNFNYLWSDNIVPEKQRYEMFNFKDPEGISKFYQLTSSNTLSNCVKASNPKQSAKKWLAPVFQESEDK